MTLVDEGINLLRLVVPSGEELREILASLKKSPRLLNPYNKDEARFILRLGWHKF